MLKLLKKFFCKSDHGKSAEVSSTTQANLKENNKGYDSENYEDVDWYDSSFDRKDAFKKRLEYMERRHNRGMW